MALTIAPSIFRCDSSQLPTIDFENKETDFSFVKIEDWQYLQIIDGTRKLVPLNRTKKNINIFARKLTNGNGSWDFDGADIDEDGNGLFKNSSVEGGAWEGGYFTTDIDRSNCSIQATALEPITLPNYYSCGISLQNSANTVEHDYRNANVHHAIILGQEYQGSVWENGEQIYRASFRYEFGDSVLIEHKDDIVRYYLIRKFPSERMELIRTTRTKIPSATTITGEAMIYFASNGLSNIFFHNNLEETINSYEQVGVAYYNKKQDGLRWQKWGDQRQIQPNGSPLEMADGEMEFSYLGNKATSRIIQLNPKALSMNNFWDFEDFFNFHKNDVEFLFVDFARLNRQEKEQEFFALFGSNLSDATTNKCIFDENVTIREAYRTGHYPKYTDSTPPTVSANLYNEGVFVGLQGDFDDETIVQKLDFYVNGEKLQSGITFDEFNSKTYLRKVRKNTLQEGDNFFWVVVKDYEGNETKSEVITYVADVTAPTVAFTTPTTNQEISGYFNITGTYSDNVEVVKVEIWLDNVKLGNAILSSGNFTYYWNSNSHSIGNYTLKAIAFDSSDNQTEITRSISIVWTVLRMSNIYCYVEADKLNLSNNTGVANWLDLSGNNNHLTMATLANRPTFLTNQLNGKPVVSFDGTNDSLTDGAGTTMTQFSFGFVYKDLVVNGNNQAIVNLNIGAYALWYLYSNSFGFAGYGYAYLSSGVYSENKGAMLFLVDCTGNNLKVYRNNYLWYNGTLSSALPSNFTVAPCLGKVDPYGGVAQGQLAMAFWKNGLMTSQNITDYFNSVNSKFALY